MVEYTRLLSIDSWRQIAHNWDHQDTVIVAVVLVGLVLIGRFVVGRKKW